jgi:hypothetical protein
VKICTQYAQKGMINIFIVVFCFALSLAFFDPFFFIGYLIGIAFFGLFQAIFMANAGGAWDNAKKIVEVELKQKGTPLHAATVVGDTVGDPFKDTSSVSLNPVIKFTTLFGLLAVEIAVKMEPVLKHALGAAIFVVALVFVYRSFYSMRIPAELGPVVHLAEQVPGNRGEAVALAVPARERVGEDAERQPARPVRGNACRHLGPLDIDERRIGQLKGTGGNLHAEHALPLRGGRDLRRNVGGAPDGL